MAHNTPAQFITFVAPIIPAINSAVSHAASPVTGPAYTQSTYNNFCKQVLWTS